jgi:DNA-binding XRE family transcriptional regulator
MEKSGPRLRANRKKQKALLSLLRQVRIEAGMRQEDLARALGMPQSVVSKFESGERRLDLLELRDVCDALTISLVQFVRRFERSLRRQPCSRVVGKKAPGSMVDPRVSGPRDIPASNPPPTTPGKSGKR